MKQEGSARQRSGGAACMGSSVLLQACCSSNPTSLETLVLVNTAGWRVVEQAGRGGALLGLSARSLVWRKLRLQVLRRYCP